MRFENYYITHAFSLVLGLEVIYLMPKPYPLKNECSHP